MKLDKVKETLKTRKGKIVAGAAVLGFAFVMFGISYAFFSYSRNGLTENTISSGAVKFHYTEKEPALNITDMMPMTDAQGKAQTGQGKYFDFSIESTTGSEFQIPYTITARVKDGSTLDPKLVKVWLSDPDATPEDEYAPVSYFGGLLNGADDTANNPNPSLTRFTDVAYASNYNERILYTGIIPANSNNITKNFRLRMWVADTANFSPTDTVIPPSCSVALDPGVTLTKEACETAGGTFTDQQVTQTYPLNDKTFTVTVNVYANGSMVGSILYSSADVSYTNPAAPGVTTVEGALDDLSTRLGS